MATATKTKPKGRPLKDDSIHIRLSSQQKELLTAAATRAGAGLSTWLLMLGLREAQKTGASNAG
jgi:uncharacterized protein (DUF1778 family)